MQQQNLAALLHLRTSPSLWPQPVRRLDRRNTAPWPPALTHLNPDSFSVNICPTERRLIEIKPHCIKTSATCADTVKGIMRKRWIGSPTCDVTHFPTSLYADEASRNIF